MIHDPLLVAALIAGTTALAFWLDHRFAALSKVGAALMALFLGAVLSNVGLVPQESPVYGVIEGPVVSLAIVYLLLSVRLADLKVAGPKMAALFVVASAGTALGAVIGALTFSGGIGAVTWKLAGAFTGTYTGGSLNFAAVGRGLELPASTFAAAAAADAVTTGIWLGIVLVAPVLLVRFAPGSAAAEDAAPAGPAADVGGGELPAADAHPYWTRVPVSLFDLVLLAALGLALLVAARWLGQQVGLVPEILWLTTIALALAQLPRIRRLSGAEQLGNLGLHLFFVVIGIRSLFRAMLQVGPEVFLYTLVVVAIHGIFLFLVGRLLRGTLPMMAVASQAAIGGPATAMAVAVSRGWPALALPGIAVGLLGYALGNYAGFGIAYLVRAILGG
ncbi:MAG: DUF819 family protein [Gemmatimonadetes bacterium]|nr:DUF819 family protein [Gemmatimonadota bacterium]NIO31039.1 DUF819 family protein [Gemmatimonadota bacterium]